MKSKYRLKCVQRAPRLLVVDDASSDVDIAAWARDVVRDPRRYRATPAEAGVVASLLVELEASR